MRSWQALIEQLLQSLDQLQTQRDFQNIRNSCDFFDRFDDPQDLLQFLNDGKSGDPEEKNDLLGSLIRGAHENPALSGTIRSILFVAMFPGLDRVFRALLPLVSGTRDPEAKLSNDIFWTFHKEIETWDFESRRRVAATLQLNVRRKVKKLCIAEATPPPQPRDSIDASERSMDQIWDQTVPDRSEEPRPDTDIIKESILKRCPVKDIDLELILGRFIQGRTFEELAQQLGITEEHARQRFLRAKKIIRSRKKSRF